MTAPQPGEIEVEDQLERRIRKPVDLLRCVLSCVGIVVLAVAGIAASATTSGVETDIVGASRRLPHALLVVVAPLALFALLILPVAMAVQLLVRRQFRRLAEAAATGVLAVVLTAVANDLLTRPAASRLYDAIIMARPGTSHAAALDPYLAGLVAYATMVGLAGLPYWRNALWAAIAVYAIVHVAALHTSILTLLITVMGGRAIGLAVRYAAGSASQRPGAVDIAGALAAAGLPVTAIRRVRRQEPRQGNPSRHYTVTTNGDGGRLDVVVYDRDQQAAGAIYRLYRRVRVRGQVSRNAPLTVEHAVERRALLSYAAEDAGAPTPRLRALVRAGPEASVLAYDHHDGTTLAQRNPGSSDTTATRSSALIFATARSAARSGPTIRASSARSWATSRRICRSLASTSPSPGSSSMAWPSSVSRMRSAVRLRCVTLRACSRPTASQIWLSSASLQPAFRSASVVPSW